MVKQRKKVLIALSGGIDSAVSAYLLVKQGYEVEAAFMKNWSSTKGLKYDECPWLADRQDALRVAAFLHIPLHTLDFEKQYEKNVLNYFFKEYAAGRTPNPDVMCNKEIKFKLLYGWAIKNGFDYLATGHYARIRRVGSRGVAVSKTSGYHLPPTTYHLERSVDEFKDQTYFIYNIKTQQLPHILFPVGGMKKPEVKQLAKKIGLPNQDKKESMGLCFVGRIRLKDFLQQKLKPKPGNIVDISSLSSRGGVQPTTKQSYPLKNCRVASQMHLRLLAMTESVIGRHEGLHNYTIGQRQGIKVGAAGPYYVAKKDLAANTLFVTNNPNDERLFTKEVQLHSVNWIAKIGKKVEGRGKIKSPLTPLSSTIFGRYRHQGELVPLAVTQIKKDLYRVVFKKPQKAVASGQSLVLYKGKECLGGGVIV